MKQIKNQIWGIDQIVNNKKDECNLITFNMRIFILYLQNRIYMYQAVINKEKAVKAKSTGWYI